MIVDEVVDIDAALVPLLRMDVSSQGPRLVVALGEKLIDYNEQFRLFLCTKNAHIDLPVETRSIVAEINFTITRAGLTSQVIKVRRLILDL